MHNRVLQQNLIYLMNEGFVGNSKFILQNATMSMTNPSTTGKSLNLQI